MLGRPYNYAAQITGLPEKVETVSAGSTLSVGGRRWHVLTGGGHSVEQVLLWCPDDEILFCADQVLARISPHVGVWAGEGVAEPLSLYLASLDRMKQAIPPSAFALPGHGPPISDLHARVDEIIAHHRQRCEIIVRACEQEARTSFGLLPLMFSREFRPGELGFALSEAVAHVNHLVEHGAIAGEMGPDGAVRFRAC
jgi:glyoxylase-like metal-dependent hydrolase (beta-lactamase superfamily II)